MSLNVIGNFYRDKSIKLSDAFAVFIKLKSDDVGSEYPECTAFTIPKFEQEEDTLVYGNTSQTFLIPKYDSCREMSLTFYESLFDGISKLTFIRNNADYSLNQKFDADGLALNVGTYTNNKIDTITIKVANNFLHKFIYAYEFKNLKVIDYDLYTLDNQTDSPCQITVKFAFESFRKFVLNEPIIQEKQTKKEKPTEKTEPIKYEPNGKVDAAPVDPEMFQIDLKNDINDSDLDLVRSEQLYNPAFNELSNINLEEETTPPELTTEIWKQNINSMDIYPELAELEDPDSLNTYNEG